MNPNEQQLAQELYRTTVADQEKIRARVLEAAHGDASRGMEGRVRPAPRRAWPKLGAGALAACMTFCLLLNVSAPFAAAVDRVPVLSSVARMVTFRQWDYADGSSSIHGEAPALEGTGNAVLESELNTLIQQKLDVLNEQAKADAAEYKQNWLDMGNPEADFTPIQYTFDYETYCTTGGMLSFVIRKQETITTDTADTYTTLYYYNLDVASGDALTLEGLLGENWKTVVADAVDAQLRQSGDSRKLSYYQEFWVDKNVSVDDSQMFFISEGGDVTVVFDEGVIAPYEDGPQSFVVKP